MEQDGIISSKKHFGKNTSMRQRERFVSKLHPFLSFSPSLRVYNIYIYMYPIPGDNKDFQLDFLLFCR